MKKTLFLLAVLVQVGCTPTIEYARRSANEPKFPTLYPKPSIVLSSTTQASETNPPASASSPEEAIKVQIDYQEASAEKLIELRRAFNTDIADSTFAGNRTVIKRTVAASITRGDFRPADRFVNFRLRIEPKNFEFVDYKGTATDYSVIDIATFSLAKTNSAGLQLVGGKPTVATGSVGTSKTLTESGQVAVKIENLTTNIDYDTLDVYREAERGIDLAGNTLVNISVTAQKNETANQTKVALVVIETKLSEKGIMLQPRDAVIKTADLQFLVPVDLWGEASFDYVIRRVSLRSNEYSEHNQTAFYETGACKNMRVTIVRARDIHIPRWSISETNEANEATSVVRLGGELGERSMIFLDYPGAQRLMHWMTTQEAVNAGARNFTFSTQGAASIRAGRYPKLKVTIASEKISPGMDNDWTCQSSTIN